MQSSETRDRALLLLLTWAEAFQKNPAYPNFLNVYHEMRVRGVEVRPALPALPPRAAFTRGHQFPAQDMAAMAPMFSPPPKEAPRHVGALWPPLPLPLIAACCRRIVPRLDAKYVSRLKRELKVWTRVL